MTTMHSMLRGALCALPFAVSAGCASRPPAVDLADWQIDDACTSKVAKHHHILDAADRMGKAIARWDRRKDVRELAHLINARARRAAGR